MPDSAVIGAGAFGTALAMILADTGAEVTLWVREPELCETIASTRINTMFMPGFTLPPSVVPTTDLGLAASGRPGGLNVSEMAAALQVSRTTLFTAFRDVLGITPIEFLTRKRLERAKDLMRRSRRPLRVIARMSGFGEPKYFLRRFKQCEGMTPTEWQRRNAGRETSP